MLQCKWCDEAYETFVSIGKHASRTHKLDRKTVRLAYFHGGIEPVCGCGCGELTTLHSSGFLQFKKGHNSRVDNSMSGKNHSDISKSKMSETRLRKFASGETKMWCEGLSIETCESLQSAARKNSENKERSEKISKHFKGMPKSEEHKQKSREGIIKAWADPILREKQSHNRMLMIKENGWEIKSALEEIFADLLRVENIHFHQHHYVREIKALYDFYLSPQLFVEVHGDFWHCNPLTKYAVPKYQSQHNNLLNDTKKKNWCIKNGITLYICWETDINHSPEEVMRGLVEALQRPV